jgi:hypothetical protein
MRLGKSKLKKIKGDASFRSFYRKTKNKRNSIIVYAKKEKEKNLLIYDAINRLLIEFLSPKGMKLPEGLKGTTYNISILCELVNCLP